jgi:hypothetical protein
MAVSRVVPVYSLIVYPLIVDPSVTDGEVQLTVVCALPAVAPTPVGTPGTLQVVAEAAFPISDWNTEFDA